jgi:hypothetical protein
MEVVPAPLGAQEILCISQQAFLDLCIFFRRFFTNFPAVAVDRFYQRSHMVGRGKLRNAVAQVEDVAGIAGP